MIALSDHDGGTSFVPSYEHVACATYRLSRLVHLNSNNDPANPANPVLSELTRLIVSRQGQEIIADQAVYLPLRAEQVSQSRALLTANP
jgi:phosphate transport system substrate-binding protein